MKPSHPLSKGLMVLTLGAFLPLLSFISFSASAERTYYRYVNDEGVQVIDDSIPPEYVSKGYEVVSLTGQVLKEVPPAPTKEELARRERQKRLEAEREAKREALRRRYSSVDDIRAARNRRLENLQANIDLLKGNLSNVRTRTEALQTRAAGMERSGREVSETVLENLRTLSREEKAILQQIEQRKAEYAETGDEFDEDIKLFKRLVKRQ